MLVVRLLGLLALIGIGGALVLWLVTGDPRYRRWAWTFFRVALVIVFVFLALLALERIFVPLA